MNLLKLIKIFHNIYIKQKYYIKRDTYSSEGEDKILFKLLQNLRFRIFFKILQKHKY